MDTKNYGPPVKNYLKIADTLLPVQKTMGLPSPYFPPQIRQNFIAQECVQERAEHEKPLKSPDSSNSDEQTRSLINGQSLSIKDFEELTASKDLPEELQSQFSARHCDLCVVQMNSVFQSRMHYHGKQHQKKVRFFMNNWMKEHGNSYSQKIRKGDAVSDSETSKDHWLYCECCGVTFTSNIHAAQHYRGRNHMRVINGKQPLKSGYFNKLTCRWQRLLHETYHSIFLKTTLKEKFSRR